MFRRSLVEVFWKLAVINTFHAWSLSIPLEKIRKLKFFRFQGVQEKTSDMIWVENFADVTIFKLRFT